MITDVLFDKTIAKVAANDRIGQFDVLDDGLQFPFVLLGDFAAKDVVIFIGPANGSSFENRTGIRRA